MAHPATRSPKRAKLEHPEVMLNADEPGFHELFDKYSAMTVDNLKVVLKNNRLPSSGVKADLVETCVDGELHGALPTCPVCGIGQLKRMQANKANVACPGYWDSEADTRRACGYACPASSVARNPWRTLEMGPPPDEEKNDGDTDAAAALDVEAFTGLSAREAADKLVEIGRSLNLALSADETTARISAGTALNLTKTDDGDLDPRKALDELKRKYTPKATPKKLPCRHPANAKYVDLLKEYTDLMEKSGESPFVIKMARGAIFALLDLDRAVTCKKDLTGKNKVDGVGTGTADKVDAIAKTGTFPKLEELRKTFQDA